MFTKFNKVAKQMKRYMDAKKQTEKWLKTFNEAANRAVTYEDFVFEVVGPFCNAEFWFRQTEKEGCELKELLQN